jgi:Xanthine and CO dehydrogenases maturation factor, XdhC/CoxF family
MILKKLTDAKTFKKEIIKAKIISAEGSVPRNKGAFMLVSKKNIYGSIGGGQLEFRIAEISKKNLLNKNFHKEVVNVPLGPSIGQCCGGYVQVMIEKYKNASVAIKNENIEINNEQELFIFGAGHIGQELSSRSLNLNFNINLIDSRAEYLNAQKNNKVTKIFANSPWLLIKNIPKDSFYIILTHSHDYDFKNY